jgi:hypothetical protein
MFFLTSDRKKYSLLQKAIEVPTEKAELFIRTACVLHKIIINVKNNGNCVILPE